MGLLSKIFGILKNNHEGNDVKFTVKTECNDVTSAIPEFQGDYAKTVFLWAHDKPSPVKQNSEYARYFLYECGIRDAVAYHKALIKEGYFQEASIEARLSAMKVPELKKALTDMGQSSTGKKEILIQKIIECADYTTIEKISPLVLYELSNLGREFLENHNDYVNIHKHRNWGVDWKEYNEMHLPGQSYYDTMFSIFNKRIVENTHCFGRNEYLNMYQLLREEGKRERAIEMLLRVLYIDLSGVEGDSVYKLYLSGVYSLKETIDSFDVAIMLAPGIIEPIKEYKDIYKDTIVDRLYEQKLPIQVCSKELFLVIVRSVLDDKYNEEDILKKLKKEYEKIVKNMK